MQFIIQHNTSKTLTTHQEVFARKEFTSSQMEQQVKGDIDVIQGEQQKYVHLCAQLAQLTVKIYQTLPISNSSTLHYPETNA